VVFVLYWVIKKQTEGIMSICSRLQNVMAERANHAKVEHLSIGLGYTAVCTSDGGIGLAYTPFDSKQSCSVVTNNQNYEGESAYGLLEQIQSADPIHRAMALALINALNHKTARALPEDRENRVLFDLLAVKQGTKVAMVGYFKPIVAKLEDRGAELEVIDTGRRIGDRNAFNDRLAHWADALIMTSTALLNDTADELLNAVGPDTRVALLGPSTPLVADAFDGLPVHVLAGTVPVSREDILREVRHGKGTPALMKFSRKPYLALQR